jgi:hypothetical protein
MDETKELHKAIKQLQDERLEIAKAYNESNAKLEEATDKLVGMVIRVIDPGWQIPGASPSNDEENNSNPLAYFGDTLRQPAGTIAPAILVSLPTSSLGWGVAATGPPVPHSLTYGIKLPTFKTGGDMETFINRFNQCCVTQEIDKRRKANLVITALDDASFTVMKRELTEKEMTDYETIKWHLLSRFDLFKEAGQ